MNREIADLAEKDVLKMIPRSEMSKGQQALKTMWVYDVKTDHLG